MLSSTWQRKNEPLVVALGHKPAGGDLVCDVVLVAEGVPKHSLELEDDAGTVYAVEAPEHWFGAAKAEAHYGVALTIQR